MDPNLVSIPKKFSSYARLNHWLNAYQEKTQNKFNVHTSESLYKVYKNRSNVDFNPLLIYDGIKFKCSTREQRELESAETCPAKLFVSTSPRKQTLQVDESNLRHNHPPMIAGRNGSSKQRTILLEKAMKLQKAMAKVAKTSNQTMKEKKKSPEEKTTNTKTVENLNVRDAVVLLNKVNIRDLTDPEYIKFLIFLDNLGPKVEKDAVLLRKKVIQLHHLSQVDKFNIKKLVNFDLEQKEQYFAKFAFLHLQLLLKAKK